MERITTPELAQQFIEHISEIIDHIGNLSE